MFRPFASSLIEMPTRLRRSIRLSPPLGLMLLTLVLLLLALGTAKADEPTADKGPKYRYGEAMAALSSVTHDDFGDWMSPGLGLTVEQLHDGMSSGRRVFTADLTSGEYESHVAPILWALADAGVPEAAAIPHLCDETGVCVRDSYDATVTIQFAEKADGLRIVSMRLDTWYEDTGCGH